MRLGARGSRGSFPARHLGACSSPWWKSRAACRARSFLPWGWRGCWLRADLGGGGSSPQAVPAPPWWPCSVLWTTRAGSHPRDAPLGLPVAATARPGTWPGAGCSGARWMCEGGASAGFGAPPPSLEQGVQVDPAFWAEAADAGSVVSLGREGSPCPAPGMAEDGRDRDLLSKRSCFFSHPYSLFINLVQFHNSQTCKAAGLFLFCLNLSEPAKFLGLARGAASTHGLPGLAWSRSLQMFSAGSGA